MTLSVLLLCLASLVQLSTAVYVLEDDYNPSNFFSKFTFLEAINPVNGFARYINESAARRDGLISQSKSSVYIGVDHTNRAPDGRRTVKLRSNKVYNAGLIVLDLAHMPGGCGTWPAFWLYGPRWPRNGEIDIIEGVDRQAANSMTLHTRRGCAVADSSRFTGALVTADCDVRTPDQPPNAGCSIDAARRGTYGAALNAGGGGVYAAEWTAHGVSVFFFPRGAVPMDIAAGTPAPRSWGKPLALFEGDCDFGDKIRRQRIVFNTAFCGNFSGHWEAGKCASEAPTCHAFVRDNPAAFRDVFWEVNSLKVYQDR